ncbi:guanylate kinase [Candidatus Peregrinibacteria bacterium CG11_big_fil_rev_8_21_14_0_20_41_10]|nr:MAG: guanylate kinase [Candidatus Peregrinibacteria bacterium CG11_big_fil_rev_8_21_14_0_20_41_10]PIZ76859.1 MAG: guanylate kinase [Candidatus Peregrinibacteria bacterium CG_4_10_14_0_2_um_filter_41_8]PJC38292.1 MAG: guanylate kinase [Candidatus Peregrinibacteria bacterium CG_4_9_14_0_2_um_filter_41_14]
MQGGNQENITGKLILILGPSGSGKGTLIRYIKANYPNYLFPVSCTTRPPRPREVDGEIYYFITKEEFKEKIEQDKFLEWAIVHEENYYGTLKSEILDPLKQGKTVFREVDVQGVESIKKIIPAKNLRTIFVTTESWQDLEKRITGRSDVAPTELEHRHKSFEKEIRFKDQCDFIIVNRQGKLNATKRELNRILNKIEKTSSTNL